ncbi:hypothetical protein ACIRD3_30620 [Kitasatospora sp. NPDC093550]|uniref:hypothetical protein n=1 Tax=Kitasatospora sp. NPDC093550 TaxID=3364089 RepID=UPI0037FC647F
MNAGGWKQWTAVLVVVTAALVGALGWALSHTGEGVSDPARPTTGTAIGTTATTPPKPPAPDVAALAASAEVTAADQALTAEIDRRLAALLPALSGAQVIGEGVQDGCGVDPAPSDGSGARWAAPTCRRQVVKYLAVTGSPGEARARWEPAMTAQGAQGADTNASPRPGEGLWYGFPRGDGDRDLLGVTLAFDDRKDPNASAAPGAGLPRTLPAPNAAATAWADRGSRPAVPVEQAAAQALAGGRRLVVLSVDEEYFTGPEPH